MAQATYCKKYNALHPGFKNRLDKAIKQKMLKAPYSSLEVEESAVPGYDFTVTVVRGSKSGPVASVGLARFEGLECVLVVEKPLKSMSTVQAVPHYELLR